MANGAWRGWTLAVVASLSAFAANLRVRAEDRVIPEARIESARGVAMGTGARAAAASTQAQAENPANLAVGGLYHMESFLSYQPTFKRVGWGAAVVDSMTSRLAAGASVRGIFGDNAAGDNSGWEAKLGLGLPLADVISVGVSGRYMRYTLSDPQAVPEREPEEGQAPDRSYKIKAFTMDAAVTVRPMSGLAIAALAYNLIDTKSPLAPMMVGGAVSLGLSAQLSLGGDVLVDLNTHKAFDGVKIVTGGGVEYLAQGVAPLRLGYLYDQGRGQHGITGGVGFVDQRVGVHLSLRQMVAGGKETTLMLAVQYFVH
jgi:hypothetical protein